jgi:DHA2 family multidrug resistance protein-like MFS transporter
VQETRGDRRWLILGVLCVAVLLVGVDNTIVNVALPTLSKQLRATNTDLQWIVDGYSLPFAGLLLAGGGFSDRFGRKRIMQSALLLFGLFSFLAARSTTIGGLITTRALMGAAAAFIFPATLSLLTTAFADPSERAKAFGVWGATAGVAIAVGPIVGGELITHFWYGSIFLVNIPIVLVSFLAGALIVPESRSPFHRRFDFAGLALGSSCVTLLVLAIIQGPEWGWKSTSTLSLFGVSLALLLGFSLYELRREGPLLDVRVFANRAFSAGAGSIATSFFCLFGFIFLVTQYFQLIRGYSALSAGVHTLPFAFVTMIVTPLGAVVALRVGTRYVVSAGLIIMGIALLWMTSIGAQAAYFGPVVETMVALAFGFSLVSAPSTAAIMGSLRADQIGAGAAVNETTREIGGTMGVAVVGSVFSSLFGPDVRRAFSHVGLTPSQLDVAQSSTQAAKAVLTRVPVGSPAHAALSRGVVTSFIDAFHRGCLVAALVAVVIGVAVFRFLPKQVVPHEELVHAKA